MFDLQQKTITIPLNFSPQNPKWASCFFLGFFILVFIVLCSRSASSWGTCSSRLVNATELWQQHILNYAARRRVFHGPPSAASEIYLNTDGDTLQNPFRKLFTPLDQFKSPICPRSACFMGDLIPQRCWLPLPVWPSLGRNVMALHRRVSPVRLCGSSCLTSAWLQFSLSLTSPGFDVLLLSHKPETCFLLTSNENSWPGVSSGGPDKRIDARRAAFSPNVPICCPAGPGPTTLSAISGVFDVRPPAGLVKRLLDAASWRCSSSQGVLARALASAAGFHSHIHLHVTPQTQHMGSSGHMFDTGLTDGAQKLHKLQVTFTRRAVGP